MNEELKFVGVVESEDEFKNLVARGYKPVVNEKTNEWFLIKRYADGTVEYYKVSPALYKLAEQLYDYQLKKSGASLSHISSIQKYREMGLTYSSLATIHTTINELRKLLLDGMTPSDKIFFSDKYRTAEAYIDAVKRGVFRSYKLKPGVAEVARNILMTIIAYTSSLATPSSIQAMITAKLLLQMFSYDPTTSGEDYTRCVEEYKKMGLDPSECKAYLDLPGYWYIRSLSASSSAVDEVNRLLNELEASLSACVGEASWSEDILQFHEVIIWLYSHACSNCKAVMSTKEFEKLQRLTIRSLGIPFFMVDIDEPVSKSVVYQYLTIKTLLIDRGLTLPILIYYNFPARRVVIWSGGLDDHKLLPIEEHMDGLVRVFFDIEIKRDPRTGEIIDIEKKGERQGASEYILRTILNRTIISEERTTKHDIVRQQVLLLLRRYGEIPRKKLIDMVSERTRVPPATVGRVLNKMAGQDIIIDENGVVKLVHVTRK